MAIDFFNEMLLAYKSFCWFISMSLMNMLHPVVALSIFVPILLGILPFFFKNDGFKNLWKDFKIKLSLAMLPIFWSFNGIWGSVFRDRGPQHQWPQYISYVLMAVLLGFIVYGLTLIVRNKGYRILSTSLFLANGYFSLFVSFCAGMSISGTWL